MQALSCALHTNKVQLLGRQVNGSTLQSCDPWEEYIVQTAPDTCLVLQVCMAADECCSLLLLLAAPAACLALLKPNLPAAGTVNTPACPPAQLIQVC